MYNRSHHKRGQWLHMVRKLGRTFGKSRLTRFPAKTPWLDRSCEVRAATHAKGAANIDVQNDGVCRM